MSGWLVVALRSDRVPALSVGLVLVTAGWSFPDSAAASVQQADRGTVARLARASVPFVANRGQWDENVAFAASTFAGTLFVAADGRLHYRLQGRGGAGASRVPARVLSEQLIDESSRPVPVRPRGREHTPTQVTYIVGDDPARHGAAVAYQRVDLGEAWPGIHVQLRAGGSNVEKIFTVAPGRNPDRIRIRVDGAARLAVDAGGDLVADTSNGPVSFSAPIAFQEAADGSREPVDVRYVVEPEGAYRFALGAFDRDRALVIDPIIATTYFGGNAPDSITAIALAPFGKGSVYVTGSTQSFGLPTSVGAPQLIHATDAGGSDAFVARFDADLGTLTALTYYGGNGDDDGVAIALSDSSVFIAGTTRSTNLPGTATGAQSTAPAAASNGFVAVFNQGLTQLVRATYVGGNGDTEIGGMALSASHVFVVGDSLATNLPLTGGAAQASHSAGGVDAFVSRLLPGLNAFVRTTYFGGGGEVGKAIAIHPQTGDVYIAGWASSLSLPAIAGGAQTIQAGLDDAFVARFAADLGSLRQSTFYGGSVNDQFRAIVIHPMTGDVYCSGITSSATLPGMALGAQNMFGGTNDGLVVRFSPDLRIAIGATYLGGSGGESALAITVHPVSGEIYVAGQVGSTGMMSSVGGAQTTLQNAADAYVVRLRSDLTAVVQSTYVGSTSGEWAAAIAIHPFTSDVYIAGQASGSGLPGAAAGAFTTFQGGSADGFVTRITADLTLIDRTPDPFAFPPKPGAIANSLATSLPVIVTGFTGSASTYLEGGANARYCISSAQDCACDILSPNTVASTITQGRYICMFNVAGTQPNQTVMSTVHVGGGAASYVVTTGPSLSAPCLLDVDGNNAQDALTDGLLILRALFGLTGTAVTNNAIGPSPTRSTWAQIQPFLNSSCGTTFSP